MLQPIQPSEFCYGKQTEYIFIVINVYAKNITAL